MSSSQQSSNNNTTYQNQILDDKNNESLNVQTSNQQFNDRGQSYENGLFQHMCPFQDDNDEDLPNEIITELDARNRVQSNINDDDSVFSDVVQDAFRKYQNEYSKYWTYNDTIWEDNKFSEEELLDDEQEELYAQMEECWNYMAQENNPSEQVQQSKLNPDATEFKPSWLKSASNTTNDESFVTVTSNQIEEQQKKI